MAVRKTHFSVLLSISPRVLAERLSRSQGECRGSRGGRRCQAQGSSPAGEMGWCGQPPVSSGDRGDAHRDASSSQVRLQRTRRLSLNLCSLVSQMPLRLEGCVSCRKSLMLYVPGPSLSCCGRKKDGKDRLGNEGDTANASWPPRQGAWSRSGSYLLLAFLQHHLELEMGQLDCPGACPCSGPARGRCCPLQGRAREQLYVHHCFTCWLCRSSQIKELIRGFAVG